MALATCHASSFVHDSCPPSLFSNCQPSSTDPTVEEEEEENEEEKEEEEEEQEEENSTRELGCIFIQI